MSHACLCVCLCLSTRRFFVQSATIIPAEALLKQSVKLRATKPQTFDQCRCLLRGRMPSSAVSLHWQCAPCMCVCNYVRIATSLELIEDSKRNAAGSIAAHAAPLRFKTLETEEAHRIRVVRKGCSTCMANQMHIGFIAAPSAPCKAWRRRTAVDASSWKGWRWLPRPCSGGCLEGRRWPFEGGRRRGRRPWESTPRRQAAI